MKKGWETVPLEVLAVQEKGAIKIGPFGSQLKKRDLTSSGIHVIGIENVLNKKFDGLGERFISPEKFGTLRTVEILPGDVLITMMGTIGRVAVVPEGISTSIMDSHLLRVRPDNKRCRTDYLAWAIYGSPAVQQSMDAQAHGAIMKGLNSAIVRSLPILLPPLAEQQRIVGLLDEAFEGLATAKSNAEKNIHNARAIFESHLQSVFARRGKGWPIKRLGEMSVQITDGTHNSPPYVESGIPMLDSKHVKDGFLIDDSDPEKFIAKETDKLLAKRCKPRRGDILISSRGTIGKIAIVREGQDFNIMGNMILIRLPADIGRDFVAFYLYSQVGHIESIARGVAQKGLYLNQVREYELPLPPQSKQVEIGKQLNALSTETWRLEALYNRKLEALEALKKSLLHQAFTGDL